MKRTGINSKEKEAIKKFILYLHSKKLPLEQVLLFGSKARGEGKRSSDIDVLAIVSSDGGKVRDLIYGGVAQVLSETGNYLSVKVFEKGEFNKLVRLKTPFIKNVLADSQVLWTRK